MGPELSPIPQIPDGLYLVSSAPDGVNGLSGERCNVEAGLGGYLGGCVHDATLTRYFQYNDNDEEREQYSAEIRLRTQLDGRANFLVGANYLSSRSHTLETYFDNLFDLLTRIGGLIPPGLQFPGSTDLSLFFYPPFIPKEAKLEFESVSAFGETYVDLTDRLTLTIGVRYNRDEKRIKDRDLFLAAFDFNAPILFNGALGPGPFWIRSDLGNPERPEIGTGLRELYDVPEGADIIQAGTIVPIVDQFNEERLFSGTPTKQTWDAWSGRIGLDWQLTDDALIYGFYSRGYKPGGFNPGTTLGFLGCDCATALEPLLTYDREEVNALEVGMKTRLLNGSVSLNVAAFYNDYDDLQLSETAIEVISTATSNGNIDAKMYGSELEARWRPVFAPRAEIEFARTHGCMPGRKTCHRDSTRTIPPVAILISSHSREMRPRASLPKSRRCCLWCLSASPLSTPLARTAHPRRNTPTAFPHGGLAIHYARTV